MRIQIPLQIVKIDDDGYHLFIDCLINQKKAFLLIDTGASKTVFDLNRIDSFFETKKRKSKIKDKLSTGLGTNSMESKSVRIDEFEIHGITYWNFNAILLNIDHVNQSYNSLQMPSIDGVLGSDILMKHKAIINYGKKTISLIS